MFMCVHKMYMCIIHTLTIRSCVPSDEMMVPLSPTSDGRVWDIQLVTIAMVLSTAPIFNMGTLILTHTHSHTPHTQTETLAGSHTQSKLLTAVMLKTAGTQHDATGKTLWTHSTVLSLRIPTVFFW